MIFTIGHSTHSIDEFLTAARGLDLIIDVRSHPTSRWEQHRKENLQNWLPQHGIAYEWWPSLGGWTKKHYKPHAAAMFDVDVDLAVYSKGAFPKQRIGRDRPERCDPDRPAWTNQGLYDYAWYTALPEFQDGVSALIERFGSSRTESAAIMCCEALWWKCHRSMIADCLYFRGTWCGHLPPKPPKRPTTPRWKVHADAIGNRIERYPAPVIETWKDHT
jgi:hypothetical protein